MGSRKALDVQKVKIRKKQLPHQTFNERKMYGWLWANVAIDGHNAIQKQDN